MSTSLATASSPASPGSRHPAVRPQTSVVFVVPPARKLGPEQLAAMLPSSVERGMEYVVSMNELPAARELQRRRRDLRCVTGAAGADLATLREAGLREASGQIVVLVELTAAIDAEWRLDRPATGALGADDARLVAARV